MTSEMKVTRLQGWHQLLMGATALSGGWLFLALATRPLSMIDDGNGKVVTVYANGRVRVCNRGRYE